MSGPELICKFKGNFNLKSLLLKNKTNKNGTTVNVNQSLDIFTLYILYSKRK